MWGSSAWGQWDNVAGRQAGSVPWDAEASLGQARLLPGKYFVSENSALKENDSRCPSRQFLPSSPIASPPLNPPNLSVADMP